MADYIVISNTDEPLKRRFVVIGPFENREAAWAKLPDVVREWIEDPEGESHTPEELEAEVKRICKTGYGDPFGFEIAIADGGSTP